jgi:signal transduction histidine kinase/CheY-like chemotaxis protein
MRTHSRSLPVSNQWLYLDKDWTVSEMQASAVELDSGLRLSPRWVIAALLVVGVIVLFIADGLRDAQLRIRVEIVGVLLCVLCISAWLLDCWWAGSSRWPVIGTLVALIILADQWLGVPGMLALLAIPVGLAAGQVGLLASFVTATAETALLVAVAQMSGTDRAELIVPLVSVWSSLAIMIATYRPLYQLNHWMWEYLRWAQSLLDESLDRKTELAHASETLRHANRQLALANERLATLRIVAEEAKKSKASFVARVSHEFRTPLNMIIGLVGLMVESTDIYAEDLPPDLWTDLNIVYRNCQHLSSMINDVLDLSQAEAGRLVLHRESVDLAGIVDSAIAVVRPMTDKKHLDLQVAMQDGLPRVHCDPVRIRQVLLNLVSNAARFTMKGKISVHVAHQDHHVIVGVSDTGPGISQEEIEKVFEPFFRGARQDRPSSDGSGLGLSISKQFVHLHGGRMWLESQPQVGTSCYFTLPISPPVEHAVRPVRWIKEDWVWKEQAFKAGRLPSTEQLLKPRILVCDETDELASELVRYTDEIEFIDVQEAAQVAPMLAQCPAHAVVLNTTSPDDLLSQVGAIGRDKPGTPVFGCAVSWPVFHAKDLGAAGHLIKPVTRADLLKAIAGIGRPVSRVLLVDDQPEVLQLWTRMLRACGQELEVITASDGRQAMEQLTKDPPDLVLLDIVMPGLDGWQVLERMAENKATRDIPVIVVSAQDPSSQPVRSPILVTTMGEGLPITQLLRCCLGLSSLLLRPDQAPEQALL